MLRGPFGPFAGEDFPCKERDAHKNAPFARGTCMLTCRQPECRRATRLCERLPECTVVSVNIEGTVATLKRESALSRRTSALKPLQFTQNLGGRPAGVDRPCAHPTAGVGRGGMCVLPCPLVNCTAATALCFETTGCIGVDVKFGAERTEARLRFQPPLQVRSNTKSTLHYCFPAHVGIP